MRTDEPENGFINRNILINSVNDYSHIILEFLITIENLKVYHWLAPREQRWPQDPPAITCGTP